MSQLQKLENHDVLRGARAPVYHRIQDAVGRALVAGIIGAVTCMVATGAYADAEPVRGRVAGMYYTLTTRTPQFPFLALWQVNENANRGSGSDATPSTSLLDADELATLPPDAFERTAYLCDGGKTVAHVENVYVGPCSISHHTAGASLVHYGFDELTFTDTSVKGVVIIFR